MKRVEYDHEKMMCTFGPSLQILIMNNDSNRVDEKFVPKGAIAFFIALMILTAIIWFGIYFLMISQTAS